jgi:hypothetical protein
MPEPRPTATSPPLDPLIPHEETRRFFGASFSPILSSSGSPVIESRTPAPCDSMMPRISALWRSASESA